MRIERFADFVIGLQYGDEGKGKIVSSIVDQKDYAYTARYNGGPNAGHTVIVGDKTLKLHQLPSSVAHKKHGYIGPGSLVDFTKLEKEAATFKEIMGFCPFRYLTISPQAIVISDAHINSDKSYHASNQGSTSSGVAPAYASFYNRTAELAEDYSWPDENNRECIKQVNQADSVLFEGAQGYYLNPYQGCYPYTTSSSCSPGAVLSNFGLPHDRIGDVVGVAKCYETRSGKDPSFHLVMNQEGEYVRPQKPLHFFKDIYSAIQIAGNEIGVTTGRKRQVRFLDLTRLINAVESTGTSILVLQKWDILEEVYKTDKRAYSYYYNGKLVTCDSLKGMIDQVKWTLQSSCCYLDEIIISASPVADIDWKEYL